MIETEKIKEVEASNEYTKQDEEKVELDVPVTIENATNKETPIIKAEKKEESDEEDDADDYLDRLEDDS